MKRLLITGANGFVGRYASEIFRSSGDYEVVQAGHAQQPLDVALDLTDAQSVERAVVFAQPDCVLHLAAQSFVPTAIEQPLETYDVNVMGSVRLASILREQGRKIRLLYVSSAEVYGFRALQMLPLTETALPHPANPYAASKLAAEALLLALRCRALEVVVARPFNHIGPGQNPHFVVAGFAQQLISILNGAAPVLSVGNLEAERDFLHVRDVVEGYLSLMKAGCDGEIYNLASGTPVAIREILRLLMYEAKMPVTVVQDPQRLRASDVPCFYGDATKLTAATGWKPQISLRDSLREILEAAGEPIGPRQVTS